MLVLAAAVVHHLLPSQQTIVVESSMAIVTTQAPALELRAKEVPLALGAAQKDSTGDLNAHLNSPANAYLVGVEMMSLTVTVIAAESVLVVEGGLVTEGAAVTELVVLAQYQERSSALWLLDEASTVQNLRGQYAGVAQVELSQAKGQHALVEPECVERQWQHYVAVARVEMILQAPSSALELLA